jgi:hypothetical protein
MSKQNPLNLKSTGEDSEHDIVKIDAAQIATDRKAMLAGEGLLELPAYLKRLHPNPKSPTRGLLEFQVEDPNVPEQPFAERWIVIKAITRATEEEAEQVHAARKARLAKPEATGSKIGKRMQAMILSAETFARVLSEQGADLTREPEGEEEGRQGLDLSALARKAASEAFASFYAQAEEAEEAEEGEQEGEQGEPSEGEEGEQEGEQDPPEGESKPKGRGRKAA